MKKLYQGLSMLYYAVCIYMMVINFTKGYTQAFLMGFVSIGLSFIIPILFKLKKWKPVYEIYILWILFILMASLLGSTYRFYTLVPYWDKITHLFSGLIGILVGYCLYCGLKKVSHVEKKDYVLMLIFVHAINISIAALWEQYEYLCLVVADYDAINHYTTGVHDSMTDIMAAIIGGVLASYFIISRYKSGKQNFFTDVYEKFYTRNIANKK